VTRTRSATAGEQRRRLLTIVIVLLALLALALAMATIQASTARPDSDHPDPARPTPSATLRPVEPADGDPTTEDAQAALSALDAVPAAGVRAPGYERDAFGSGWLDTDHNGCDSRNDVLARDLDDETFRAGSHCIVVAGVLDDPYTATEIRFVRGAGTSDDVQTDHIVPLSWAWGYGAGAWPDDLRQQFANDPRNLRAVDGSANMSKGDSGPGEWMPSNAAFHCEYVVEFVAVVVDYRLALPDADRRVIRDVLLGC
jgi:hypothetical protein